MAASVWVSHEGVEVGRTVILDCHLLCPEVIANPAARDAVSQGRNIFKALRAGEPDERVVAKAGCAVMNAGLSEDSGQQALADQIRGYVVDSAGDEVANAVDKPIKKAASAIRAAQLHGGVGRWYFEYCLT
ncbi:hypothetical protein [Phycicoccus sp. Soil748]|uniref:hypothetical protein n=1 Tax=Phycicoccus sp. Soil748 TaxID=1736397 RepID=UPI00138F0EC3|nr:hypothetical protein [Phycicoccus sp. Soil748]